ncbi:MAG: radical SAM protein, partial [Bacteroidota bacterium]|nr:radical SAM protein [Bacteroidota bacterium]
MKNLPQKLILEVTARCNFHCPFCYCVWHERPELAGDDLPTTEWQAMIEECIYRGVNDFLFTGGEATLRKDIWQLLAFTREKLPKAPIALFTNAANLTEKNIVFCREHAIALATSLQGLKTYAIQTGTRRSYAKLLVTIARAAELQCPFDVSITVTQINKNEIADIFAAAVLSHAKSIQMGPMMLEGRARNLDNWALSWDEWETVKETIRNLPNGGVSYGFVDEMLCDCRPQPSHY